MKKNFIVLIFMLIASFAARAEKTWRHDHDVCKVSNELIDVDLHSNEQYSVSADDDYGEVLFLKHDKNNFRIDLRQSGIGRYKMLKLHNKFCPKILLLDSGKNEIALFFLKDNRPFNDQIVVIHYNTKGHDYKITHTNLSGKNFSLIDNKLFFISSYGDSDLDTGNVTIDGMKYNFIEKPLEPWVSYNGSETRFEPQHTWEKFEYKHFVRSSQFSRLQNYQNIKYKIAFNPFLKKKCFSLNGEAWKCH